MSHKEVLKHTILGLRAVCVQAAWPCLPWPPGGLVGHWDPGGMDRGPGEPLCWLGLAPASRFPVGTQEHTRDENVRYLGTQRAYGVLVLSVIVQMYALCQ